MLVRGVSRPHVSENSLVTRIALLTGGLDLGFAHSTTDIES